MGEREFRADRALPLLFFAMTASIAVVGLVVGDSAFGTFLLLSWMSSGYPVVLALRARVVVGEESILIRWVLRSRSIDRRDVVGLRRRRRGIHLDVRTEGVRRTVTLPAVSDNAGLERLLRGEAVDLAGSERPELVIHQGGLVRRWSGSTYVVEG